MRNALRRAAVATAAVAAASLSLLTVGIPANAATENWSSNWSGYYAEPSSAITAASVQFTVPNVKCQNSRGVPQAGKEPYQAFMWVGVGGINGEFGVQSGWLKQDGIVGYCPSRKSTAAVVFEPFWEYVPPSGPGNNSAYLPRTWGSARVYAGEHVWADVYKDGSTWYFEVSASYNSDDPKPWTAHVTLPSSSRNQSAEVVTERPATGLLDLGSVRYTYADYYTSQVNDYPSSIASHPIDLLTTSKPRAVIIYPTAPSASLEQGIRDAFSTVYASDWLLTP